MTRHVFVGSGIAAPGSGCTVWTDAIGGEQVLELVDRGAVPSEDGVVVADAGGSVLFLGPDETPGATAAAELWVQPPHGERQRVTGRDPAVLAVEAVGLAEAAVPAVEKGRPNGVATLDTTGKVPESQLPEMLTDPRQPVISLDELTFPLYVPHRGGANIAPENTIDALRGAVELGFKLVEVDCSRLRDGGLMVMHDATADRTSNLHGAPHELLTAAVLRGRIDASTWFAAGWPSDLWIPALSDVLREVGNHICLLIEAKNPGSGRAAAELVTRSELGHSVIMASFIRSELDGALEAGLPAGLVHESGDLDHARLRADGVDYLVVRPTAAEATLVSALEAGLVVFVYDLDRRYVHDLLVELGVHGFITDDPMYLSRRLAPLTVDPYVSQTFWHGCLPAPNGDRGYFAHPDWWGYPARPDGPVPSGYRGALQGWACPVTSDGAGASPYSIGFDVVIDEVAGEMAGADASIFFGAPDDRPFPGDRDTPEPQGYRALLRADGGLEVHRVDAGRTTLLVSTRTPALALGETVARIEITVTTEDVTVARTDTDSPHRIAASDATHRGGYIHLGCQGAAVRFRNVTVTR
ncbi:MAG: hypothetical protein GEU93_00365 [Propionibacteriales bacterium]|nr:hypothetical protein [Propionibacteriales bacterium]